MAEAVRVAERAAATAARAADNTRAAARAAATAAAAAAAAAAARAARAAADAAADTAYATAYTSYAARCAVDAALVADTAYTAYTASLGAIRADFDLLVLAAAQRGWTDRTPVPPEVFGPLWPDGPPPGWPVESSEDEEVVLEIDIPAGSSEEVIAAFVGRLADQADDLHRALGGRGLKVETVEVYDDNSGRGRKAVAS